MRAALTTALLLLCVPAAAVADRNRDFDFEFGDWTVDLSRLAAPLTGSDQWIDYSGTSVVRPVWGGRANLGELAVSGSGGAIEGMSLRVFDPAENQWRIHWTNARAGIVGEPMIGGFENGLGHFYNEEDFDGRRVRVRFIFSEITDTTFRLEQAFSPDDGETWEPNWIARFTRASSTDDAHAAGAWAAIDNAWNARDAGAFSALFTDDAIMSFVDRDQTMSGRALIREVFAERFAGFAPDLVHKATVQRVRAVAHGVLAVDSDVVVLRQGADEETAPVRLRTFRVFALLSQVEQDWRFRDMRIMQMPEIAESGSSPR